MVALHLRRSVRDAVVQALTGLQATGNRVYSSRVYPVDDASLPALLVSTSRDVVTGSSLSIPRTFERTVIVDVIAVAKAISDIDDILDEICRQVEVALAMPCSALAGIAQRITLQETQIRITGEGSIPTGEAAMSFEVFYMAAENSPHVAF